MCLVKEDLLSVATLFPSVDKRLRRAQIRTAAYRGFIISAYHRLFLRGHPKGRSVDGVPGMGAVSTFTNKAVSSHDLLGLRSITPEEIQRNADDTIDKLEERMDAQYDDLLLKLAQANERLRKVTSKTKY